MAPAPHDVTRLLKDWGGGDQTALRVFTCGKNFQLRTPRWRRIFIRPLIITSYAHGSRMPALRLSLSNPRLQHAKFLIYAQSSYFRGKTESLVVSELPPQAIRMLSLLNVLDSFSPIESPIHFVNSHGPKRRRYSGDSIKPRTILFSTSG